MSELESYAYGVSLCGYWDGSKYRVQLADDKLYLIKTLSRVYDRTFYRIKRQARQDQSCIYLPQPDLHPYDKHTVRGIYDSRGNTYKNRLYIRHSEDVVARMTKILPEISYREYFCSPFSDNLRFYIGQHTEIQKFLDWIYTGASYYLDEKYQKYLAFSAKSV